jgi:hypothetical protein
MNLSKDVKTQHNDPEALGRGTTRSIKDLINKIRTLVDQYYRNSKPSMGTVTTQ